MAKPSNSPAANTALLGALVKDDIEQIFEIIGDGVMMVQDHRIKAVNQRIVEMYGGDLNRLIGLPVMDVLPEFARIQRPVQDPTDAFELSAAADAIETEFLPMDRVPIGISVKGLAVRRPHETPALLLLLRPIIDRVPIGRAEVQAARQLESIAALSGGIAHDFNNLLTVIIGNISLIQSYIDENDFIYKMLQEAHEASMMAKALSQKLITFSKGGEPLRLTTALPPLIRSTGEFSLSGSNIKAEFDLPSDLLLVEIDQTQISQTIHNIITNAREAMPQGGTVHICARNAAFAPANDEQVEPGKYVKIEISDQGAGISEDHLDKIFDPYFSTKERGVQKGMGLGLSICHSIVEKHNGWMRVQSRRHVGTSVQIFLPASEKSHIEETVAPVEPSSHMQPGQGRILVMDDEEMIIKLAGLILERLGYQAEFAGHGRQAVDKYRDALAAGEPFDAVILDLTVRGGLGGQEAIRELRALDPSVRGIVSSGYSDSPVLTDYRRYGFKGVVVKPYSLAELSRVLHQVLND